MKQKTYYCYSLVNPINNKHFYVGRTDNPTIRLIAHISQSRAMKTEKDILIRKILNAGERPKMVIHYELTINTVHFLGYVAIEDLEQHLIFCLLRKKQPLLNCLIRGPYIHIDPKIFDKMWNYYERRRMHPKMLVHQQMKKFFTNQK